MDLFRAIGQGEQREAYRGRFGGQKFFRGGGSFRRLKGKKSGKGNHQKRNANHRPLGKPGWRFPILQTRFPLLTGQNVGAVLKNILKKGRPHDDEATSRGPRVSRNSLKEAGGVCASRSQAGAKHPLRRCAGELKTSPTTATGGENAKKKTKKTNWKGEK